MFKNFKENNFKNINFSSGQASRLLLILAIVILVAVAIVFVVMKVATPPPAPVTEEVVGPKAVYETTIGDIKFTFLEARDMGKALYGTNSRFSDWQENLTTTEKFIMVKIGAQNKGKVNIPERVWTIGDIVDSEGRSFVPLDRTADPWLPEVDLCGTLLKPEFAPTPCIKMYEVARIATGLKIKVISHGKTATGEYSLDEKDQEVSLIDLIVTQ